MKEKMARATRYASLLCTGASKAKCFQRHPNIACNLAQQWRRDVTSGVKGNGGLSAIRMPVLLVRTTLPNFHKPQPFQYGSHLTRL